MAKIEELETEKIILIGKMKEEVEMVKMSHMPKIKALSGQITRMKRDNKKSEMAKNVRKFR